MDGLSNPQAQTGAQVLRPGFGRSRITPDSASAMTMRWSALHDAAAVVASLAHAGAIATPPETRDFPAIMRDASGWRRELAEQGLDDLSAMMEPGLAALLAAHAQGGDTRPAAQALWREFTAARDALLTLAPVTTPAA